MLDVDALREFFDAHFTRTAFRLETLDEYAVGSDGGDVARYLAGEPEPDPERKRPWLDALRNEAARGLYRHRVHVLTSPLNAYLRYECEWGYAPNTAASEDIRILDLAERPLPDAVVDHDFWLLDDAHVLRMHYDDAGRFLYGSLVAEPLVGLYRAARNAAWAVAEPFGTWWSARPHEHRASWAS